MPTALGLDVADSIYTVSNEEIAVVFDPDANYMPSSFTHAGGPELLYTGEANTERFMGIGYFIDPSINEYSWRGSNADLVVLEEGPAVVQIEVTWDTDDASTDASLYGTTVYTILPDGRIVRREEFHFAHASTPEANAYLTAYLSLDASEFDHVRSNFPFVNCRGALECDVGDAFDVAIYGYGYAEEDTWLCATDQGSPSSVSWMIDSDSPTGEELVSARLTEVNSGAGEHSLAMQYDWARGGTTPIGDYGLDVLAYVVEDDPECACSLEHFEAYGAQTAPTADSGVQSRDYAPWGAYYDVVVNADTVGLTFGNPPLPPTMLLRVDGRSTVTGVMIDEEDLVEGDDYLTQTGIQDENSAWLYLARPLDVGETLTITMMR